MGNLIMSKNELVMENDPDIIKDPNASIESLLLLIKIGGLELQVLEHPNANSQLINRILDGIDCVNSTNLIILEKIAKHDRVNEHICDRLLNNKDYSTLNYFRIFYHLARNPNTPYSIIKKLLVMGEVEKIGVAENPSNNVQMLEMLSDDESPYVRICVARNPITPAHLLVKLYDNIIAGRHNNFSHNFRLSPYRLYNNDDVLSNVASHANSPDYIINALSEQFPLRVLENPNVSTELLETLLINLAGQHDPIIRLTIARNKKTPSYILMNLVDSIIKLPKITFSEVNILTAIIFNDNVTQEILSKLSTIDNELIRLRLKNKHSYII